MITHRARRRRLNRAKRHPLLVVRAIDAQIDSACSALNAAGENATLLLDAGIISPRELDAIYRREETIQAKLDSFVGAVRRAVERGKP